MGGTTGTSDLDAKGEIQMVEAIRMRVRTQDTGTEQLVVVMKWL